jgi:very-short-patch-repair endonuclease
MGSSGPDDRAIARLAGRQYGVVSRPQLLAIGVSARQIQRRLSSGRLLRLHRAVYAVGHQAPRREARWLAAVLACGDGAVLSHRSAGALWGILTIDGVPDVTAFGHRRMPGVCTHEAALTDADRTTRERIPVTSPARTLVDLAHVLDDAALARAVREAQFRRLFHPPSVQAVLERRPSRRLHALLEDLAPTQSVLEDELLALCDRHGIPRPLTQQPLAGRRVDFLWPAERIVVETDGFEAHSTASAFQRDRTATNALQLAGHTVLRFTHADVRRRPLAVAGQIRAALGQKRGQRVA